MPKEFVGFNRGLSRREALRALTYGGAGLLFVSCGPSIPPAITPTPVLSCEFPEGKIPTDPKLVLVNAGAIGPIRRLVIYSDPEFGEGSVALIHQTENLKWYRIRSELVEAGQGSSLQPGVLFDGFFPNRVSGECDVRHPIPRLSVGGVGQIALGVGNTEEEMAEALLYEVRRTELGFKGVLLRRTRLDPGGTVQAVP